MSDALVFTNAWFGPRILAVWERLFRDRPPARILEVGCFEGASTCALIRHFARSRPLELHCVDTWGGGLEHQPGGPCEADMREVEARFDRNTRITREAAGQPVDFRKHKAASDLALAGLLSAVGREHFDFIYIDGSHQAADVLCDAVLGFRLLKVGGILGFDDFLWHQPGTPLDLLRCPKAAIDAFSTLHFDRLRAVHGSIQQFYFEKTGR